MGLPEAGIDRKSKILQWNGGGANRFCRSTVKVIVTHKKPQGTNLRAIRSIKTPFHIFNCDQLVVAMLAVFAGKTNHFTSNPMIRTSILQLDSSKSRRIKPNNRKSFARRIIF